MMRNLCYQYQLPSSDACGGTPLTCDVPCTEEDVRCLPKLPVLPDCYCPTPTTTTSTSPQTPTKTLTPTDDTTAPPLAPPLEDYLLWLMLLLLLLLVLVAIVLIFYICRRRRRRQHSKRKEDDNGFRLVLASKRGKYDVRLRTRRAGKSSRVPDHSPPVQVPKSPEVDQNEERSEIEGEGNASETKRDRESSLHGEKEGSAEERGEA